MEFIQKFLGDSPVMKPEPTGIIPFYKADSTIRVILFDIYGTILISASGDIEESDINSKNLELSLNAAGIRIMASHKNKQAMLIQMLQSFRDEIWRVHDKERSLEMPYPEIDILSIWENILSKQTYLKNLDIPDSLCIKCFTFVFETLSNRIYPMPGMKEVIGKLSATGLPLGIISNAQFYTPVILNYFLNDILGERETVAPFDPEITVFSYKYMRAKPDPYLFEIVTSYCREKFHVEPGQILFIGNDMFRDVYPAHQAGYKTVLFAGDNRSLRLREEKRELSHIKPDYIITDLQQLLNIIV